MSPSYSVFALVVLYGLGYCQSTSPENIFPVLIVLAPLGNSIADVKLSIASWAKFSYLLRLTEVLNYDEVPLRFETISKEELITKTEAEIEQEARTRLRVRNVTSKHAFKQDALFFRRVNVQLFKGDFAFIYGKTGSGKTTFLETILGEQSTTTGSIHIADASLAYCGQHTWLPDTSIQLCITGGQTVDKARYRAAVTACRLPMEMTSVAYSMNTNIGPNGCYLSRTVRAKMVST